ncbi:MAG: hypothetical protein BGO21_07990 [Dyadobacter sp. 50-39]|uniref:hypothetical protein n=1 Tax=Dyadobacter sp. 50-39 TaxID=1895756 RepID=UPI000961F22B|nr:hypothetical protein [Dyadobacter sp. 50-39]OJV20510.1 MAG: hypothetical protein BGO21_07990 [Dyadobacter sp. 50-39]
MPQAGAVTSKGNTIEQIIGLPDHGQQVELEEIFQVMLDESSGSQALKYDILNGLLLVLVACLIECLRVGQTPPISREAVIVSSFLTNLENNFWSRKRVSEYASELFVSPGYLSEVVRRVSGYPAKFFKNFSGSNFSNFRARRAVGS